MKSTPRPTLSPQYLAGLFDGNGSLSITVSTGRAKRRPPYPSSVMLRISKSKGHGIPILQLLQEQFGGKISGHYWRLTSAAAVADFLRLIRPHSLFKSPHITAALQFASRIGDRQSRVTDREAAVRWGLRETLIAINAGKNLGDKPLARVAGGAS